MVLVRLSLTLYQFLGYLIPGSVANLAIIFLGIDFFAFPVGVLQDASLATVVVFVASAYLVGFLIQAALTGRVERWLFWLPERGEMPSRFLIQDNNKAYSQAFKSQIALLQRKYNRSSAGKLRKQECFNLLYSRSIADGRGQLIETFNALYALSRGLTIAFLIATAVPVTALVSCSSFPDDWYNSTSQRVLVAVFIVAALLCARRARSYGVRFADEVYRVGLTYEMYIPK